MVLAGWLIELDLHGCVWEHRMVVETYWKQHEVSAFLSFTSDHLTSCVDLLIFTSFILF